MTVENALGLCVSIREYVEGMLDEVSNLKLGQCNGVGVTRLDSKQQQ